MDQLPDELLLAIIDKLHKKDKYISWAFVCKRLYNLYVKRRDSNKLIAKRFERVTKRFNECNEQQKIGVIFDRMIQVRGSNNAPYLAIIVKAYFPKFITKENIIIRLRYTMDKWKTYACEILHLEDIYERGNVNQSTWCTFIDKPIHRDNIWFAIELINKGNIINETNIHEYWRYDPYHLSGHEMDRIEPHRKLWYNPIENIWDNNNGWNYSADKEYEHIPNHHICSDYHSLNRWIVGGSDYNYYIN